MQLIAADVADRLKSQAESVVRELLPHGKIQGREWVCGSVDGDAGKSLKVALTGDRAGLWKDFASSDKGGDLLDLWAQSRGCDMGTAITQACEFLGIQRPALSNGPKKTYKKPERHPDKERSVRKVHPVSAWLESQGLTFDSVSAYRVAAYGKDAVMFPFIRNGELVHVQYRGIREKKFWASEGTELILFGWQAIPPNAREVVICEGMKDAMSWYEYGFPALSVPAGGGGNGKQGVWIASEYDNLARFDRIYISMDADGPGQEAVATLVERLGRHRCFVVNLPDGYNDVNDCLKAKVEPEIIRKCVDRARTMDPASLINIGDFEREIIEQFHPPAGKLQGIQTPFEEHAGTFQFHLGATTMLVGRNGGGKSTMIGHMLLDAMAQGFNCCVASLEFRVPRYASWIVRQGVCDPAPSPERISQAVEKLSERLWAFSPGNKAGHGSAKVEAIIETWEYAAARYGCKFFILDNFSKLMFNGKDELVDQKAAITLLTEFGVQHNVHVLVAAHPRKSGSGEDDRVSKMDVRGHGALTDLPDAVLILSRNKRKENLMKDRRAFADLPPEEAARVESQPDAWLACEKNRLGDDEPTITLYFDRNSKQYVKFQRGTPRIYL